MRTKQREVELAVKEACRDLTAECEYDDSVWPESIRIDDRDIEHIARVAIEAADRWEKLNGR